MSGARTASRGRPHRSGGAAGIVLELAGAAIRAMVFFGTAALGVMMWVMSPVDVSQD